jgi:hypothetical protein
MDVNGRDTAFVFVVCGAREHIDTLHYALEALRKVTDSRIIVVTDRSRNELAIAHDDVVNVQVPAQFDHHQASIFLKTGLHRILPAGPLYCYLDTDVVALDTEVNDIFGHYAAPITFGADHCRADQFSPAALRCGCDSMFQAWETELKGLFLKYKDLSRPPENEEKKRILEQKLEDIKKDRLRYKLISWRFNLSKRFFHLDEDSILDKRNQVWVDRHGNPILYENTVESAVDIIERETPYRLDRGDGITWLRDGKNVFDCRCGHLNEAISETFGIEVKQPDWQHWNGGVFLFDERSHSFLDDWHRMTLEAFALPYWKTRDQGTLIATVWKHGLQDHPVLDPKFNFIADHGHRERKHLGNLEFEVAGVDGKVRPAFIHVYHHWADPLWDVWQEVEKHTGMAIDPDSHTVNGLWIGSRLSKLELLTIQSFLHHGHRFRLWVYNPLETPLPEGVLLADANEIIPKEQVFSYRNKNSYGHGKGSYAGFSDLFRYKLLYEKGGWWADMDITCLRPLYTDRAYFFRPHHELPVVGNLMRCPKGSELMRRCYEEGIATIDEHNTDWHAPIEILNRHIAELGLERYIVSDVSNPDQWAITSQLLWGEMEPDAQWQVIHWQNEEWRAQRVSKEHFYHRSSMAALMRQHGLIEKPASAWAETLNGLRHHRYVRAISRLF